MQPPEAHITISQCRLHLLGTIAGFVPDGQRVAAALEAKPEAVGLGIPPEDLAGLSLLAGTDNPVGLIDDSEPMPEALDEPAGAPGTEGIHMMHDHAMEREERAKKGETDRPFVGLDPTQERLMELLAPFGPTRIPSPDLETAFAWCQQHDTRIEALDMDDETHSSVYVKAVGFRQAWKSGRVLNKLVKQEFEAASAYDLAQQWDAFANQQKALQTVEATRAEHMAGAIWDLCEGRQHALAVVPSTLFLAVHSHLQGARS